MVCGRDSHRTAQKFSFCPPNLDRIFRLWLNRGELARIQDESRPNLRFQVVLGGGGGRFRAMAAPAARIAGPFCRDGWSLLGLKGPVPGWGYWPFSIPTGFESDGWPLLPRLERVCLYDVLRPGVSFDVVGWISVSGTEQAAALYRLLAAQRIDLAQRSTVPQSR